MLLSKRHDVVSAEYIVFDCLFRHCLHQWYVLVRSRVEYYLRTELQKEFVHFVIIGNRDYLDVQIVICSVRAKKFLLNVVSAVLVYVDDYYTPWFVFRYLTAKFRADRAAAARHHDDLVVYIACYAHVVKGNLLTSQKVADIDVAHLLGDVDVVYHLAHIRQDLDLTLSGIAVCENALSCFAA